jgi:hypothetical protein
VKQGPIETLELRLTDEQIAAIRLRIKNRRRVIAESEVNTQRNWELVDLGNIDCESQNMNEPPDDCRETES